MKPHVRPARGCLSAALSGNACFQHFYSHLFTFNSVKHEDFNPGPWFNLTVLSPHGLAGAPLPQHV